MPLRSLILALLALPVMAHATVYNVNSGMSVATLNSNFTTAAASTGNTVQFAAGTYPVGAYNTPCSNGVIYQGTASVQPNISNLPTAIIPGRGAGISSFTIPSNGTGYGSPGAACTFRYLQFNGTGGGIYISYPASGINIQYNYFTLNDGTPQCPTTGSPPCSGPGGNSQGFSNAIANIFVNGNCGNSGPPTVTCTSSLGVSQLQIDSNTFYNNCRSIRVITYEAGGSCAATWFQGWNSNVTLTNNIVNGIEEGFKWNETYFLTNTVTNSLLLQNNQFQNHSRIAIENQQNTNGNAVMSHNSFTQPGGGLGVAPGFPTFDISFPANQAPPAGILNDNTLAAGAPSGNHYGIGMEVWGQSMNGQFNVLLSSNTCAGNAAFWIITMGGNNAGQSWTNNYFSGCEVWDGTPNSVTNAFSVEAGAVLSNATLNPNTVVQTTVNLTTATPTISPSSGTGAQTVTLADSDSAHRNVSIFYTTDGSTPMPFVFGGGAGTTQVYSAPFSVPGGTTVKTLALWGTGANQGLTYSPYFGWNPSSVASVTYGGATGHYVSPTGNDSNSGAIGSPWLTPNHALNCGDSIIALSGSYSASNFTSGKWGTVTCPTANNVVWLTCQAFDTCKISASGVDAMWVDQDFWGVQGWENTVTAGTNGACFRATPSGSYVLHHVIFANDIANGCRGGGFVSYTTGTGLGTDYLVKVGNIAYNAAQGSANCFSGFSDYEPVNFDVVAGTHFFTAGNFSFDNTNPNPCAGGTPTDGEGFIVDTPDGVQGGKPVYTGQIVVENNLSVWNGGRGVEVVNNSVGGANPNIYFKFNTSFGNSIDPNQTGGCFDRGELYQQTAINITWFGDLAQTRAGTSCSSEPLYGFTAIPTATNSIINSSWWSGTGGHNTDPNTPSFVLGSGNTIGTNPAFTNPVDVGAPSCGSSSSVPACMAAVLSNYTPTAGGSTAFGYQTPSAISVTDPLYPAWLCSVTLPAGLVTPGCGSGPAPTLTSCNQGNVGNINTLTVGGGSVQMTGFCSYASTGQNLQCYPVPDTYSNTITAFGTSNSSFLTVTTGGLATGVAAGSANSTATATGSVSCNVWTFGISNPTGPSQFQLSGSPKISGKYTITP